MNSSVMCFISTDRQKCKLKFGVLFVYVPYMVPEIGPFYIYGARPLVSILKSFNKTSVFASKFDTLSFSCIFLFTNWKEIYKCWSYV